MMSHESETDVTAMAQYIPRARSSFLRQQQNRRGVRVVAWRISCPLIVYCLTMAGPRKGVQGLMVVQENGASE
jgi:hypothetical protein